VSIVETLAGLWAYALATAGAMPATDPAHLLAGAALAVVVVTMATCLLPRVGGMRGQPAATMVATLRERARRRPAPRHCDPDAAGHRRARAPSARPSVA
jgi:hypothetical protein